MCGHFRDHISGERRGCRPDGAGVHLGCVPDECYSKPIIILVMFQAAEKLLFESWPPTDNEVAVVLKLWWWQGFCSTTTCFFIQ